MQSSSRSGPTWAEIEEATKSEFGSPAEPLLISPLWHHDDTAVTDFGPYPLDDELEIVVCADCGKVVLREALGFHQRNCQLVRDIKEGRASPSILEGDLKKRQLMDDDDSPMDGEVVRPTKKTKKAEAEARRKARLELKELKRKEKKKGGRKNKGPVDVDKQCGVINDKGLPCSRSLTCKSHSMGAKRAVEGRSAPYDQLLFEWQKATNPSFAAKQEEKEKALAAKAAAAAAPPKEKKKKSTAKADREAGGGGGGGSGGKKGGSRAEAKDGGGGGSAAKLIEDDDMDLNDIGADTVQIDQELYGIVGAIATAAARDRTTPLPLATRGFAGSYTSRAKRMRNLRELLREGLAGGGPSRASVVPNGFNANGRVWAASSGGNKKSLASAA
ncbi:SAGA complex subunit Sgf73 [Thecaphora frezii]